ncbi:2367_t:CDS:2 [Ambispora gerdemannii]|uniref:2367_t:CDS:1 n=1 Tax=Ambispora gerdemannii TaxID=144530 RepID=A0A9N9CYU9_9GLOM|nr:2367_t:CDS:2 [Ambispora gerdemannii]
MTDNIDIAYLMPFKTQQQQLYYHHFENFNANNENHAISFNVINASLYSSSENNDPIYFHLSNVNFNSNNNSFTDNEIHDSIHYDNNEISVHQHLITFTSWNHYQQQHYSNSLASSTTVNENSEILTNPTQNDLKADEDCNKHYSDSDNSDNDFHFEICNSSHELMNFFVE